MVRIFIHTILRIVLQQLPEIELGKVVVAGVPSKQSDLEEVLVFILHKGNLETFLPIVSKVKILANEQFGIEAHQVIPISKVPKTTSGKIQRSALADDYQAGMYDETLAQLRELAKQNFSNEVIEQGDEVLNSIKQICKEALPDKTFTIHDSLLEVGASSLALVEIHTGLDELYPGKIEITDLVEHPTIQDLANFLHQKDSLVV